ncbi:MAG: NADH-quinone oxidoreductase subunit NuoE [Actinomycetota bacterium]|nr:NADH-quinone oxidoreductase subunit NuoE [Actinomycetota bacterium]
MSTLGRVAEQMIANYPEGRQRSALVPLLRHAEDENGFVSAEAMQQIAELIGVTSAEVKSVATFYTMLHMKPRGHHILAVCHNLACSLMGAERIIGAVEGHLGVTAGGTTADGEFTLERAECLAFCDKAPMMQIDHREMHGPLTVEAAIALIESVRTPAIPATSEPMPEVEPLPAPLAAPITKAEPVADTEPEPQVETHGEEVEVPTTSEVMVEAEREAESLLSAGLDLFEPYADDDFILEEVIELSAPEQPAPEQPAPEQPAPEQPAPDDAALLRGHRKPYSAERLLDIEIDDAGVGPGPADPREIGAPMPDDDNVRRPRGAE